jgi:hypothetical protein
VIGVNLFFSGSLFFSIEGKEGVVKGGFRPLLPAHGFCPP